MITMDSIARVYSDCFPITSNHRIEFFKHLVKFDKWFVQRHHHLLWNGDDDSVCIEKHSCYITIHLNEVLAASYYIQHNINSLDMIQLAASGWDNTNWNNGFTEGRQIVHELHEFMRKWGRYEHS